MNITGIITEYNPIHNGHVYHINQTKKILNCDAVVCIMSGNFVQRGEAALTDKWSRAKAALKCGIDLIIELPALYALSSAEFFAFGAVSLLNSIGIVNNICFGSEIGDTALLKGIAAILIEEPYEFKAYLKAELESGLSYPVSRMNSLKKYAELKGLDLESKLIEDIMSSSNNILGIEYIKSLMKLNSSIAPFTIKRIGSSYNSLEMSELPSATSIRNHLKGGNNITDLKNAIPSAMEEELLRNSRNLIFTDEIFKFIKYKAFMSKDTLKKLPDVSEGLENKIYDSLCNSPDLSSAIDMIKSKRYAYTRISRILTQYFIGFDCYNTGILRKQPCPYAHILGFNSKGREILKLMKKKSTIPIIIKMPKDKSDVINLDLKATRAYSLINPSIKFNADYLEKPVII